MALQISNAGGGSADELAERMRRAIEAALPGASAQVRPLSPGHFEIEVSAACFAGRSRVQQHQSVYAAIREWMSGDAAPVHAIDRLECRTP